jgi:glycosyltransferase involved in cell wall biosynthesis
VRVLVLTTSYPRSPADVAGSFVADGVRALRGAGVEVTVVSPADFNHFGIAYGHGIVQNLRARPWLVLLVPAFIVSFALTSRRAAHGVDVVHAHWLPSAIPALATRKPFVLQVWGTDVELARRVPRVARWLVRRARVVIGASTFLADQARALGARDVRVVPTPVEIPEHVGEPEEPPHVLFAGRLSEEKGILEFLEATEGLPRVIVGDGPLRDRVPEAVGFVSREALGGYYDCAAVVCVPSRREGYGMVAREAMAHGRPVVATAVGGLADLGDGVSLAPAQDVLALRASLQELLTDAVKRATLGSIARRRASDSFAASGIARSLLDLYGEVSR